MPSTSYGCYASTSGNDTLEAGGGNYDYLYGGGGADTLVGGSGSDTFVFYGNPAAGTTIEGGSGTSTLKIYSGDISGATISGVQTLQAYNVTLTADELAGFTTVTPDYYSSGIINTAGAGTYDLAGKGSAEFDMFAATNDGVTLIGNDADYEGLHASTSGNDTLEAGGGNYDYLYDGGGVDTLIGGSGSDTFVLSGTTTTGTTIEGGTGTSTLKIYSGDISGATISGVQTLQAYNVTLTADELAGFTTLTPDYYSSGVINTAGAGTYDLAGKSSSEFDMYAATNDGVTLIGNDADYEGLYGSTSGNDTLEAGGGNYDRLYGGGGYDTYKFNSSFGQDTVYNSGGSSASEKWISSAVRRMKTSGSSRMAMI